MKVYRIKNGKGLYLCMPNDNEIYCQNTFFGSESQLTYITPNKRTAEAIINIAPPRFSPESLTIEECDVKVLN